MLGPEAVIPVMPDVSRHNQFVDAILGRLTADAGNVQHGVYTPLAGSSSGFLHVLPQIEAGCADQGIALAGNCQMADYTFGRNQSAL